jgi:hypothetical protein
MTAVRAPASAQAGDGVRRRGDALKNVQKFKGKVVEMASSRDSRKRERSRKIDA